MKYFSNNAWHELTYKVGDTLPIGSIIPFGGNTAPSGWLICDGSNVSRTQYAVLFNVIGTTFGEGDGSLTFTIPDFRGRNPIGVSDTYTLGSKGGEETHKLTVNEMPKHKHKFDYWNNWDGSGAVDAGSGSGVMARLNKQADWSGGTEAGMVDAGGDQAHNNMQPYQVTNYIIKAYQSVANIAKVVNEKTNNEVDTYSCKYINDLIINEYSEAEKIVGKWVNGKPVYERTLTTTLPSSQGTWTTIYANATNNVDELVDIKGNFKEGTAQFVAPMGEGQYYINMRLNDNNIMCIRNGWSSVPVKITIQYTKTTD